MYEHLKKHIRTIPDFPKKGIQFRDVTTLMKNPEAFGEVIRALTERYKGKDVDLVAGIESRGFIFGAPVAAALGRGFVPVRKRGKLPAETVSRAYSLEYGENVVEIHKDAVTRGARVVIIDDLLATGGTMLAACNLVEALGGRVAECAVVVDLPDLKGREKIKDYEYFHLIDFEGE